MIKREASRAKSIKLYVICRLISLAEQYFERPILYIIFYQCLTKVFFLKCDKQIYLTSNSLGRYLLSGSLYHDPNAYYKVVMLSHMSQVQQL
jgi:hypothetical protein